MKGYHSSQKGYTKGVPFLSKMVYKRGEAIPVAVFMGDDVQLPPVCDAPVYVSDCRSAPSNHGRLVWTNYV